jgi:hypothetical protein
MKMKKFTPFFIPDSHKRICESGLSGPVLAWRGQRHGRNGSDGDEMQALLTGNGSIAKAVLSENYTIRMLEGVRRSRSPQMDIPIMPLPDQEKRAIRYISCSRIRTI